MNKRIIAPLLGVAVAVAGFAVTPSAQAMVAPQPRVATTAPAPAPAAVRTVRLFIDNYAVIGTTVSGFVQLSDVQGFDIAPVVGVPVALQEKRGSSYVTIADGVTDAGGRFAVSWTVDTNTTLRPIYTQASGRTVGGPAVAMAAVANVTWAVRPDMDLPHGTAFTYGFRINPSSLGTTGHFEIASAKAPTKWVKNKSVTRSNYGILSQRIVFPKAGTYLLRGASDASKTNGVGYTSTLTIKVT